MAKNITKNRSLNIKGVVDISSDGNEIFVTVEDADESYTLAELIKDFNGAEVTISVKESIDIA